MIVWRRERRDLKFMALSIGRIYSGAVALDWRQRLSRFRSSATPPTCVRVRDRPTLSNARSHLKTPREQSGRKRARQAGFAYAPARLFRAHSARAAPRAIPSTRSSHLIATDSPISWRSVAARRLISPLSTTSSHDCANPAKMASAFPAGLRKANRLNQNPADSILAKCSALQSRSRAKTKRLAN